MYGPVPIGSESVKVVGFLIEPQIDSGRIATPAMFSRLVYWGVGKVTVTVSPLLVTEPMFRPARLIAGFCLM